jgi:MoxR-like ATPase
MDIAHELELSLRSRFALVCLVSSEEERVVEVVRRVCEKGARPLHLWDHAEFFQPGEGLETLQGAKDPLSVLEAIDRFEGNGVFLLRDFHQCWQGQPRVVRKLRSVAQRLKYTKKSIFLSMPDGELPRELRDEAVIIELPPPETDELGAVLDSLVATPGVRSTLDADGRSRLVRAALGLSVAQARRVFARAVVSNGVLDERDIALVTAEKQQIIKESGALTFYPVSATAADVGGLEVLKGWLREREGAFTDAARDYGLPPPKGVALIGIPGTGKSLSAKMIAGIWQVPLIRLDIGALFGSLVGQSEANTRRALQLAETVAPCLLWIDEIEKALSAGGGDGGTSMRVLGSILSWMQEKTKPVFVVATANDISRLPPELLRRGRFDEVFFLDLPTAPERRAIFDVHFRKRRRDPATFDLERLVTASAGFVGAEIEQALIDAMYVAFSDRAQPGREVTSDDVARAIARVVPLSRSQREAIGALRQWLGEGRAQSASFVESREAARAFVPLEPSVA